MSSTWPRIFRDRYPVLGFSIRFTLKERHERYAWNRFSSHEYPQDTLYDDGFFTALYSNNSIFRGATVCLLKKSVRLVLHINANSTTANYSLAAELSTSSRRSSQSIFARQSVPLCSCCVNAKFRETQIAYCFSPLREISTKVISVEERRCCNGKIIVDGLQINSPALSSSGRRFISSFPIFFNAFSVRSFFTEEHVSVKRDNLRSRYSFGVAIFSLSITALLNGDRQ